MCRSNFELPRKPHSMRWPRLLLPVFLLLIAGCGGGQSPEEKIDLKLNTYREMAIRYSDVMAEVNDGDMTAAEAQDELGMDYVQRLAELELEIRSLIQTNRTSLSEEEAATYLEELETYRQLIQYR